jgi:hypothetical protein
MLVAPVHAQPIVMIDSAGKALGRLLNESVVLIDAATGVVAPASIRPIYASDGKAASGLAAWQSGGTVLFTSADCTTGAFVHSPALAGARGAAQVQTREGILLYVGAIGMPTTQAIRSILYDTGCSPVSVQQNGLHPVVVTLNLTTRFPPPLSLQ